MSTTMKSVKPILRGPKLEKDKGYAWVILMMSTLSYFFNFGFLGGIIGNLTIIHKQYFGIDIEESSLIGSLNMCIAYGTAPIGSVLVKKWGCRWTQIFGSVCFILGVGLSAFSTQAWHAYVLFSGLAGLGSSLTYLASSQILVLHFDKYKQVALSVAMLGYFAGSLLFPVVTQEILDDFGYSKAMAIMSSFHVIHLVAGILYYEPDGRLHEATPAQDVKIDTISAKVGVDDWSIIDTNQVENMDSTTYGKVEYQIYKEETYEQEKTNTTPELGVTQKPNLDSSALPTTRSLKDEFITGLKSFKVWCLLLHGVLWTCNTISFFTLVNDFVYHEINSSEKEVALGITLLGKQVEQSCTLFGLDT